MHTMTKRQGKSGTIDVKALLAKGEEFLRALVRAALQEVLEAEMSEALGAEKGERTAGRLGHRSGYYGRTLITRNRDLGADQGSWPLAIDRCQVGQQFFQYRTEMTPMALRARQDQRIRRGSQRDVDAVELKPGGAPPPGLPISASQQAM
jgi:hypothetical protein